MSGKTSVEESEYTVYILYSEKLHKHYTGQTVDLAARIERHNRGYEKGTKGGVPWKVVFSETVGSRSEAMKLEYRIKKVGARRFMVSIHASKFLAI